MDFDQMLPLWRPDPYALAEYSADGKSITPFDKPNGPISVVVEDEDGGLAECVLPHARYLRAVDPAGNVVPVVASTNRVDVHDGTGYEDKVKRVKRAQGWLFLDDPPYGLDGQAWADHVDQAIEQRRAKHAVLEQRRGTNYKTHQQALAESNGQMMEELIKRMFKELRAIKADEAKASEEDGE